MNTSMTTQFSMANAAVLCVICCVVTTFAFSVFGETRTRSGSFRGHHGFRKIAADQVARFDAASKIHCSLRCVQEYECRSFNLGPVGLTGVRRCELLRADNTSVETVIAEAGWTCMEIKCEHLTAFVAAAPDDALTASSSYPHSVDHGPANSRLYTQQTSAIIGAWQAHMTGVNEYIQIDLEGIKHLSAIATQCRAAPVPQCVTSYYVNVKSSTNEDFAPVCDRDQACPRLFTGNEVTDNLELVVVKTFDWLIVARCVRLNPQTWDPVISMRWELYGCE